MDTVVSRLGLKAECSLRIGVDGLAGGLVWVLVFQSDLIAALLLHALRQVADGNQAAHTEPEREKTLQLCSIWSASW